MDRSDFRQTEKRNDTGKEESAKGTQEGFLSDCRQTRKWNENGKEDSAKETQEGCLSRSIRSFSNNFYRIFCSKNLLQRGDKTLSPR